MYVLEQLGYAVHVKTKDLHVKYACCSYHVPFQGFRPHPAQTSIHGRIWLGKFPDTFLYKDLVLTLEELEMDLDMIPAKVEKLYMQLIDTAEGDCFDYWAKSIRREAGITD